MTSPRDSGVGTSVAPPPLAGSNAHWDSLDSAGFTDVQLDAPPLSLQESLDAGWMTAGEKRYYEGTATEVDLAEAGYSTEEILEILEEQRERKEASK
ncbi:MAG: hypothetical protein ABJE95_39575 [Byssovorax sp.]